MLTLNGKHVCKHHGMAISALRRLHTASTARLLCMVRENPFKSFVIFAVKFVGVCCILFSIYHLSYVRRRCINFNNCFCAHFFPFLSCLLYVLLHICYGCIFFCLYFFVFGQKWIETLDVQESKLFLCDFQSSFFHLIFFSNQH